MSACETLTANASLGVAPALRAVDCLGNETTAAAFGRLFGGAGAGGGGLLPALTILLTLYIAFFAISLLTGRSRLGISALTPRALTLGLVLTFATSWVAYQSVVWNLATGAPDQIAGVLLGSQGSATLLFADRIDMIFAAIAEVGAVGEGGAQGATPQVSSSFTPNNLMWLGALLLLLGTVGVLVTARIALAVLLALGPIFVVLALFSGTRGLTAGWLRGLVLTAVTPLFVVLGGGLVVELLVPVIAQLRGETGVDGRAALALFLIAAVHVALMVMVMKVAGTMVAGWSAFGLGSTSERGGSDRSPVAASQLAGLPGARTAPAAQPAAARRSAAAAAFIAAPVDVSGQAPGGIPQGRTSRTHITQIPGTPSHQPPLPAMRGRGIGSRFRERPAQFRETIR